MNVYHIWCNLKDGVRVRGEEKFRPAGFPGALVSGA